MMIYTFYDEKKTKKKKEKKRKEQKEKRERERESTIGKTNTTAQLTIV